MSYLFLLYTYFNLAYLRLLRVAYYNAIVSLTSVICKKHTLTYLVENPLKIIGRLLYPKNILAVENRIVYNYITLN